MASNRFGDRTSIDAHESQLTAEVDSVTNEEEARCRGMLLAPTHQGNAVGIEDTQVADQLVEATAVAGRRDHRIGLYAGTVRQHDIALVEADDRGDNLDAPGPELLDEPVVVRRCLLPAHHRGRDPFGRPWEPVLVEAAEQDSLYQPCDLVGYA